MPRDYALEQADQAGREDDLTFGEVIERYRARPAESDDERHLRTAMCDELEYLAHKCRFDTRQDSGNRLNEALEQMPSNKMRLALMEIRETAEKPDAFRLVPHIFQLATRALK